MSVPRFVLARAAGNSVTLRDTAKKRLALIIPRDLTMPEDKADSAAVAMAEICAAALNKVCEGSKGGAQ